MVPTAGTAGMPMGCNDLKVVPKPVTPTVLILVDNSSSMFDTPLNDPPWPILYNALMDPANGALAPLEDSVRFGFASYRGSKTPTAEDSAACNTITSVPFALNNYRAIDETYKRLGTEWKPGLEWETPTGNAVMQVTKELVAYMADPPGPKYILLVTDGNPNTCQVANPQCGQDLSIKAVQDAKAQGIGTFVVGIGDIIAGNSGCETRWGRCGTDHLQDIANAGQGQPVQAPPADYVYQSCAAGANGGMGMLYATYAAAGETPGKERYYTARDGAELRTALTGLLNSVASCTFDMDAIVNGDPGLGTVTVGGERAVYNAADGWRLEDNHYQVTLQGRACETFKTAAAELSISFPCEVAVPR